MASANLITSHHYFDQRLSWTKRVVVCAAEFNAEHGMLPTVARISSFCSGYPEWVGPIRLMRGKGLYEFEMEMSAEIKEAA